MAARIAGFFWLGVLLSAIGDQGFRFLAESEGSAPLLKRSQQSWTE